MIQKINRFLITRFPLIWNTRIVFLLPIVLLVHVLFYLWGYGRPFELSDLDNYQYFRTDDSTSFSVLISLVVLIVWLVYFLRNNPLKAHYPISHKYLFGEFFLIFIVFFASSSFFLTYKQGMYDQVRRVTKQVNLVEDANAINLAAHFIPFERSQYYSYMRCDSIEAREQRREERRKIYYDAIARGEKLDVGYIDYEPEPSDSVFSSFLFYCQKKVSIDADSLTRSSKENSLIVERWLYSEARDSVKKALDDFYSILRKYGISHRFSPSGQAASVFAHPDFYIGDTLYSSYDEAEYNGTETVDLPFIPIYTLNECLTKIENTNKGFWNSAYVLGLFYYAFSMAILLFSFRLIRGRTWFISLIGVGIWAILLVLIHSGFGIGDNGTSISLLLLYAIFITMATLLIYDQAKKWLSGLFFIWAMWMQLAVFPLIWWALREVNRHATERLDLYQTGEETAPTVYTTWMNDHWEEFFSANLLLTLLILVFVYIPLARKWQANPEE